MDLKTNLENVYNNISIISSSRYVKKSKKIIEAKYNCYDSKEELRRAEIVYQLLLKGRNKKSIIKALKKNLEEFVLYWIF